ncbi:MAG: hypothetical protein HY868_18070 [Chloroflexi bacterium]|nr:hypothetical protein [Chloroflexota bacterium]
MNQITADLGTNRTILTSRHTFAVYKDRLNLLSQIDVLESLVIPTLRAQSHNPMSHQSLQEAETRLAELKNRLNVLEID